MTRKSDRWKGLQRLTIHLGVFDYDIKVIIGPEGLAHQFAEWFTKKDIEPIEGRLGFCLFCEPYLPIVWIPRRPRTPREHATLAHECLHAVGHVTRWAAIQHSKETEEVFCHALGYLVDRILKEAK